MSGLLTRWIPAAVFLLLFSVVFSAETEVEFFEKKVRPVLAANCYKCHSVESKKLKGDLLLDHIESVKKGGDSGPAVVPGDLEKSLLIETIRYKNIDMQMPPNGKLPDDEIAVLEKWVTMGAPWPDEPVPVAGNRESFDWKARKAAHWCWQPITAAEPPAASKDEGWDQPIDRFIRAKQSEKGLSPAAAADPRTWIRRVTLDLTGLPPSVADVDAFMDDNEEDAKERVVDRLLASPRFGERWARHWLDLVRYAESCGHEFDYNLNGAHGYRDYVIRAFNANVPYDDLLREHVAGDLLESPRRHPEEDFNESVMGTGFWFLHEAVHAPTDVRKDEAERMDNQIDVFSKTFLGLTVSCARCHDHKFDAIPTSDYYAIAGYLQSSRMDQAMLDPGGRIAAAAAKLKTLRERAQAPQETIINTLAAAHGVDSWKPPAKKEEVEEIDLLEKPAAADIVFEDFESGYDGWKVEGKAFRDRPSTGTEDRQQEVKGFFGKGLVNSYTGEGASRDEPIGRMTSAAFTIERDFVHLLVGGGYHEGTTCVNLLVEGKPVRTAVGRGETDRELLSSRSWNVEEFKGRKAQIEIVDQQKGHWGHINADHIVFSNTADIKPDGASPADEKNRKAIEALAAKFKVSSAAISQVVDSPTNDKKHSLYVWHRLRNAKDLPAERERLATELTSQEMAFAASLEKGLPIPLKQCLMSGEAFGEGPGADGVMRSGRLSNKLQGVLRTPTFELTGDVWCRVRAQKAEIRLIIDNYMMQPFNGLLFGGTRTHNLDTKGQWQWHKLGSSMYHGHRAYLEFNDRNDGFIEISHIVHGARPAEPPNPVSLAVARDESVTDADSLFKSIAKALKQTGHAADLGNNPAIAEEIAKLETSIPGPRTALAMTDGTGEDEFVFIRGSHKNLGEVAPRRLLVAIAGEDQPSHQTGSGRLELAERMLDPSNPFPARVMVNRLWHHLFGRGIVPTVDDFGEMGQPPSHPELLDWLANDFRRDWDIKRALKQITLSATYAQSSAPSAVTASGIDTKDPDNVYLHRMPIRRLQAEAIRDSVLAVSGRLDTRMYGGPVAVHLTSFQGGRGRPGSGPLDGSGRRSIYLSVRRNFMSSFLKTYDSPTPFSTMGRRSVSNVPAQALVMMNDPFVVAEAKRWGAEVAKQEGEADAKISAIYQRALAREPSSVELEKASAFVAAQSEALGKAPNSPEVWSDLCHVVFNLKEFIYLP